MKTQLTALFYETFSASAELLVRSPGRINFIGEHLDYNNGWVLPASIDKAIYLAGSLRKDGMVKVFAADLGQSDSFPVNQAQEKGKDSWSNYLRGIVDQLFKAGFVLQGCEVVITGDIPLGGGLSSSAALECGFAFLLKELNHLDISRRDIALMGQRSENSFVGMNCGIMDQFACVFGRAGQVIRLDCRNLDYEYFPFQFPDIDIVLCDTGVKHSFGSGENQYNKRRADCENGVELLKQWLPKIESLRDVSMEDFQEFGTRLTGNIYRRCRYVVGEIERVGAACKDLEKGDLEAFGEKMYLTHNGLQQDYEVSCQELDFLVEIAKNEKSCLGARMMGGGFGGCTINLMKKDGTPAFIDFASRKYQQQFNIPLKTYVTRIERGLDLL